MQSKLVVRRGKISCYQPQYELQIKFYAYFMYLKFVIKSNLCVYQNLLTLYLGHQARNYFIDLFYAIIDRPGL